jgi:hypothetical protein
MFHFYKIYRFFSSFIDMNLQTVKNHFNEIVEIKLYKKTYDIPLLSFLHLLFSEDNIISLPF